MEGWAAILPEPQRYGFRDVRSTNRKTGNFMSNGEMAHMQEKVGLQPDGTSSWSSHLTIGSISKPSIKTTPHFSASTP
jgi:hypothetical protein